MPSFVIWKIGRVVEPPINPSTKKSLDVEETKVGRMRKGVKGLLIPIPTLAGQPTAV